MAKFLSNSSLFCPHTNDTIQNGTIHFRSSSDGACPVPLPTVTAFTGSCDDFYSTVPFEQKMEESRNTTTPMAQNSNDQL